MTAQRCRRFSLSTAMVALLAFAQPPAALAQAQSFEFNIPAQNLENALRNFARTTRQQVVFRGPLVRGKRSSPLVGQFGARAGLERMLQGTGLAVGTSPRGVLVVAVAKGGRGMPGESGGNETTAEAVAADAAEEESAEIVVTAQKKTERLLDVPVPVSAIFAQGLATTNQLRVQDYFRTIPGLSLALAGNGSQPVLTIRGINTGDAVNPTVGVVINEISYGASAATGSQIPAPPDIDPSDLERVEVLRGPQGTLYGASSIGGLIKFVTISPSTRGFSARVQAGLSTMAESSEIGHSLRGSINVPLNSELAVRASGFFSREPGYVDNAESGERDANGRRSAGGRLAALWRPSDAFSLRLEAVYQDAKRLGADEADTALSGSPRQAYLPGTGIYRRTSQLYTATANLRLGSVELVSATGYSRDKLADNVDLSSAFGGFYAATANDAFGVDRAIANSDVDVSKFSQELRATVPITSSVSWLIGGFYTREKTNSIVDTQAVDANRAKAGSLAYFEYEDGKFEDLAFFSNLTIEFGDRFDVQIGGRYSSNSQDYPVFRTGYLLQGDSFTPRLQSDDTAFTYLLTPRFKPSPDLMIYARLASGYRPGGPNVLCGEPGVPCTFSSDTTENYDLGLKGVVFDGLMTVDASLYYINWKDLQLPNICTLNCVAQYTANASRATSKGLELAIGLRPGGKVEIDGWFAYNDAKLAEDLPPGSLFGLKGDRLPYSSRYSGSLTARKMFALGDRTTAYVQGTASYVGRRVGDFKFTADRQTYRSYVQLDLRAGASFGDFDVDLYANNLTNRRSIIRGGLDSLFEPSYVNYIQPRSIGFSVSRSF
jgi:outer membrane receptor protein involved in Fe transport